MEMEKKKQLTMRSSSCTGMNRLIVIDLEVDKESERQRYGQTNMWATGKDTDEKDVDSHYKG